MGKGRPWSPDNDEQQFLAVPLPGGGDGTTAGSAL
jgi:hypothetical protein